MSILIWILIGFLVYSFVIVPVFMELSLDKPKKTEDGRLRIKKEGFVIKFFYGANVSRKRTYKRFPINTCLLYKGIYGGILFFCLVNPWVFVLIACFFVVLYGVAGPFAFIAGYLPNPVGFAKKENEDPFYPYEERSGYKTWIAPWKFIVPIGMVALIYFFHREIFIGLVKIAHPLSSNVALVIYSSVVELVFLVIIINKTRKTESFAAMKETAVSFIKKMCKEIEIT